MPPAAAKGAIGKMIHVAEFRRTAIGAVIDDSIEMRPSPTPWPRKTTAVLSAILFPVRADQGLGDHVGIVADAAGNAQNPFKRLHNRNVAGPEGRAPRGFLR